MLQNAKVTTLTGFELQLVVTAEFPLQVLPFLGGGKILPTQIRFKSWIANVLITEIIQSIANWNQSTSV